MYQKLNFQLENIDISRIKGSFMEGYGPFFRSYEIADPEYLNDLIKNKIRFHIPYTNCSFTTVSHKGVTDPHIDTSMTALNYYVNSSSGETTFYKAIDPNLREMTPQLLGQGNQAISETYRYDIKNLIKIGSFVSNNNEAWLLNVHTIHNVTKLPLSPHRTILRWLWYDVPFEEVLSSIEIL
jgi:hypothetical protein